MQAKIPYKNLEHTLQCLKLQVIDSLPHIQKYIPSDITTPEELFYFLKENVVYKKDPKGVELLQTVQTLMKNRGRGDCDCFTILTLASCIYLEFFSIEHPLLVALVGKNKITPSHIYSLVYDDKQKKYCVMDLTNPYYCMERKYNYKQTLKFMILELADNFIPLSGKTARKAKRAVKQAAKVQKKTIRQQGKVARVQARVAKKTVKREQKTARKIATQERRTDRRVQKGERKAVKRATKVARKEKGLIRVQGKQDIIKARQQETLNRIQNRQQEETYDPSFSPESDQAFLPDEQTVPGSSYQPSEGDDYYDYEQMPSEEDYYEEPTSEEEYYEEPEEEYYEEEEGLSLPFIPAAIGLINKIAGKVKGKVAQVKQTKAVKTATKGASQYNEIMGLKKDNSRLKLELEKESKNKYIYSGIGTTAGIVAGVLIGRATK